MSATFVYGFGVIHPSSPSPAIRPLYAAWKACDDYAMSALSQSVRASSGRSGYPADLAAAVAKREAQEALGYAAIRERLFEIMLTKRAGE